MAKITGASLTPIYNRLNAVGPYHPLSAKTFNDWSVEAGDVISVSRDNVEYSSPLNNTTMVWRGQPEMTVNATGKEKRDSIAKTSQKKYGSQSGIKTSKNYEYLRHEVYDSDGRLSILANTAEGLRHEVYDTDGRFSLLQNTVDGLKHEVYDSDGRFSTLQNTVNGLKHEVYDTDGKFSSLQNTVNGLKHEVYDTDGRFSTMQNTVDGLKHEVYDSDGSFAKLASTAKGLYHEVYDSTGRFANLSSTVDGLKHEVYDTDGKFSSLQNTVNGLKHEVYDTDGKFSSLQNTVNGLKHEVYDTDGKFSSLQNTVNGLKHEVYDTDGRFSTMQNTVDGLKHEVYDSDGSFAKLASTAKGLYHEVYDSTGRFANLSSTVTGLKHEVYDTDGSFSRLQNTVDGLSSEVYDYAGRVSTLENTAEGLRHEVYDTDGKFATLSATAQGLAYEVYGTDGAVSHLKNTADEFEIRLENVVDTSGNIKAGRIAVAMNNSGSTVYIEANKIRLDGDTTLAGTLKIEDGSLAVDKAAVFKGNVTLTGTDKYIQASQYNVPSSGKIQFTGSGTGETYSITTDVLKGMVRKAEVDGNNLKIWMFTDADNNPSISFSKATSLSGEWSGGTYTVTANPQGNTKTVGFNGTEDSKVGLYSNGAASAIQSLRKSGTIPIKLVETVGTTQNTVYTTSITTNCEAIWANGWDDAIAEIEYPAVLPSGSGESVDFTLSVPNAGRTGHDTKTFSMSKGTPAASGYASVSLSGSVVAKIDIGNWYTSGKDQGWKDAYAKVSFPGASTTNESATLKTPNATNSSNPLQNSNVFSMSIANNTADLMYAQDSGTAITVARVTHNKYDNGKSQGWKDAYAKVSFPGASTTNTSATLKTPNATNSSNPLQNSNVFSMSIANNTADLMYAKDNGTAITVARVTHNKYDAGLAKGVTDGWGAARQICTIPTAQALSNTTLTCVWPDATEGNPDSKTYTINVTNDKAQIKYGSNVVAQVSHTKYTGVTISSITAPDITATETHATVTVTATASNTNSDTQNFTLQKNTYTVSGETRPCVLLYKGGTTGGHVVGRIDTKSILSDITLTDGGWSSGAITVTANYNSTAISGKTHTINLPDLQTVTVTYTGQSYTAGTKTYTNNDDGYCVLTEGSGSGGSGCDCGIVYKWTIKQGNKTDAHGSNALTKRMIQSPANELYKHAYGQGYTNGAAAQKIVKQAWDTSSSQVSFTRSTSSGTTTASVKIGAKTSGTSGSNTFGWSDGTFKAMIQDAANANDIKDTGYIVSTTIGTPSISSISCESSSATITGRTSYGSFKKSQLSAPGYLFFTLKVRGKELKGYFTVNA